MFFLSSAISQTGNKQNHGRTPIMGWSSWNHFRVNINEQIIREQADAIISSGMYDAGYRFINIDDGYFGGRDSKGNLFPDSYKFPSGMKALADYIHSRGLKAGIYSDAGTNTCGSIWDNDKNGLGVGMYNHVKEDCDLFFKNWGYDFLKVDWCGGENQKLDEQTEYLSILHEVKSIRPEIVFNICRWQFPGEWAVKAADSWRISGDINATWKSICHIIDLNAGLAKYASPGHFNDMDMLQVGRGMSYEEDKAHFSMWCMMTSPLLAGNDLRKMTKETIEILTNNELITLNQDSACIQAERILIDGTTEVWLKPLGEKNGKNKAIAVLNRGESSIMYSLTNNIVPIGKKANVRDLWQHKDLGKFGKGIKLTIPEHGIVVLKISE
ncbi:MAG: glycoside hydrolase family 27 protein [Prolixibacteraceae bacterium]|nr:glycoside hydrolase family 27 protein [Prolixibacteraceae bacterium]